MQRGLLLMCAQAVPREETANGKVPPVIQAARGPRARRLSTSRAGTVFAKAARMPAARRPRATWPTATSRSPAATPWAAASATGMPAAPGAAAAGLSPLAAILAGLTGGAVGPRADGRGSAARSAGGAPQPEPAAARRRRFVAERYRHDDRCRRAGLMSRLATAGPA